jgi:ferredoxin-NADP reductase
LHDRVDVGDYLEVGPPVGNFVLSDPLPAKLLLLSGGGGATPVFSILKDLARRGLVGDVVWLHAAKTGQDIVFASALLELAAEHSGLQVKFVLEDTDGRLSPLRLGQMVPDLAERHTMMCGPSGMMEVLGPVWEQLDGHMQTEEFTATPHSFAVSDLKGDVQVLTGSKKVTVKQSLPLLESLEQAGQKPAYGCRMGVCGTCQCTKKSGVVQNMLTGEVSGEPDEVIRLCISRPLTDTSLTF